MKKMAILLAVLLIAGMFFTLVSCGTHMAETGNENNDNTEQESPAQPEDDDTDSENNSALYAISYNGLRVDRKQQKMPDLPFHFV